MRSVGRLERVGAEGGANAGPRDHRLAWLAVGGALGALASSSCCILPVLLFSLGAGGAWLGNLSALSPYQPIFIVITLGLLGGGFRLVHHRPQRSCGSLQSCVQPAPRTVVKLALWISAFLLAAAVAFPYVAPSLLGV